MLPLKSPMGDRRVVYIIRSDANPDRHYTGLTSESTDGFTGTTPVRPESGPDTGRGVSSRRSHPVIALSQYLTRPSHRFPRRGRKAILQAASANIRLSEAHPHGSGASRCRPAPIHGVCSSAFSAEYRWHSVAIQQTAGCQPTAAEQPRPTTYLPRDQGLAESGNDVRSSCFGLRVPVAGREPSTRTSTRRTGGHQRRQSQQAECQRSQRQGNGRSGVSSRLAGPADMTLSGAVDDAVCPR
jgi:hypothetical protein